MTDNEIRLAEIICSDSHHAHKGEFIRYRSAEKAGILKQLLDDLGIMYSYRVRDTKHDFHMGLGLNEDMLRTRLGIKNNQLVGSNRV